MSKTVTPGTTNPIRDGFGPVTPYLYIRSAARAIEFYKAAFGASEIARLEAPDDKIMYAALKIEQSAIMLSDEFPETGVRSPQTLGGSPVPVHLYVANVDAFVAHAIEAGAKLARPVQDQFFGDRSGVIEDPFGHVWMIATQTEKLSWDEINVRFKAMFARGA